MIGIYKITSPSNRVYIGQSVNIQKRFITYKNLRCKTQTKLYNSFLKYGVEKHYFEVIEECNIETLNERERHYQDFYDVLNHGLNCRLTTTLDKSGYLCDLTKLKLKGRKNHFKGKKHSAESINKMIFSSTGKFHTEKTKIKLSIIRKGKSNYKLGTKQTEETKSKISLGCKGKKLSEKHKAILLENKLKIILNIETGIFYLGLKEVSDSCGIPKGRLANHLNGTNKINKTNFIYV